MTTPNTGLTTVYHPAGFRVSIAFDENATPELFTALASKIDMIIAAGFTAQLPGLEPGEEKESMTRVCRRQFIRRDGETADVIDFYADWTTRKWAHLYINGAEDIAQFERQSGLEYGKLPIMEGTSSIELPSTGQHPKVVTAKTPFDMVKKHVGEHDNGMKKYEYRYFNEAAVSNQTDPEPQQPANVVTGNFTANEQPPASNGNGSTGGRIVDVTVVKVMTLPHHSDVKHILFSEKAEITTVYSRKPFGEAGWLDYDSNDWKEVGEHKPTEPMPIKVQQQPDGNWKFVSVEDHPFKALAEGNGKPPANSKKAAAPF